jgi:F-type H+-transporting ATPase subunit delta
MSVSVVARRYATALLELGLETGEIDRLAGEIEGLAGAWDESAELRGAIENPLVPIEAKKNILQDVAERLGVGHTARNTVMLLLDRRRMRTLPLVARYLREANDARKGLLRAEVITAAPLSDAYYTKLQAQLEKMTGKKVALERRQDPTLIAGVVTRIGDRVYDGSIRSRLQSMRDALMPTT